MLAKISIATHVLIVNARREPEVMANKRPKESTYSFTRLWLFCKVGEKRKNKSAHQKVKNKPFLFFTGEKAKNKRGASKSCLKDSNQIEWNLQGIIQCGPLTGECVWQGKGRRKWRLITHQLHNGLEMTFCWRLTTPSTTTSTTSTTMKDTKFASFASAWDVILDTELRLE